MLFLWAFSVENTVLSWLKSINLSKCHFQENNLIVLVNKTCSLWIIVVIARSNPQSGLQLAMLFNILPTIEKIKTWWQHIWLTNNTTMIFLEHLEASFSESRMKGHSYSSLLYSYEKSSIFLIQISFSSQKCWRLYPKRILGVVFMGFFSFITCYYPVALVKLGSVIYSTQSNLSEKSWP